MPAFAEPEDLERRWPAASSKDGDVVEQRLDDASLWMRIWFPNSTTSTDPDTIAALEMVCCAIVKRSFLNEDAEGRASTSEAVGPFSHQVAFSNPDGNLYVTKAEKELLEALLGRSGPTAVSMTAWGL
jgi:phage gp36-like protein